MTTLATLTIENEKRALILATSYMTGKFHRNSTTDVKNLVEYCKNRGLNLILDCNANAYHELWGSKYKS